MLLWVTAIVALLLAAAAWNRAGRLARKLEALEPVLLGIALRLHASQITGGPPRSRNRTGRAAARPPVPRETVAFVSLNSMKKKG